MYEYMSVHMKTKDADLKIYFYIFIHDCLGAKVCMQN